MSKAKKRKSPIRRLAELIADDLFTGGDSKVADRLVMVDKDNKMGGGWCHGAVVDVIVRAFSDSSKVDWSDRT
jgi:hypothetical protein